MEGFFRNWRERKELITRKLLAKEKKGLFQARLSSFRVRIRIYHADYLFFLSQGKKDIWTRPMQQIISLVLTNQRIPNWQIKHTFHTIQKLWSLVFIQMS